MGKQAEDQAAKILYKQNYKILERNWYCRDGEIDIIAHKNGVISFIEVRSQKYTPNRRFHPIINRHKLGKLRKSIYKYLEITDQENERWKLEALYIFKNPIYDNYRKTEITKSY